MSRDRILGRIAMATLLVAVPLPAAGSGEAEEKADWKARMAELVVTSALPADLTHPEGRTRWDLTMVARGAGFERSVSVSAGRIVREESGRRISYDGPAPEAGASDALRWLMPHRQETRGETLRPGARDRLELVESSHGRADRLRIETEIVGIGWVHLPSGPRETVLQRALISREPHGLRGFTAERLAHRWIDPRAGVVAEVWGPPAASQSARTSVEGALVLEQMLLGAASLKIYVDELDQPPYTAIGYGWDRGSGTTVASLTPAGHTTIGQMIAADSWDFSANTSGIERASTTTPLDATETCNFNECGYNSPPAPPGTALDREDRAFSDPDTLFKINTVTQTEERPADLTIWLRAGTQNEGRSGSLGTGESRFCYVTDASGTRTPVPLWRFSNQDSGGWFMQPGDPAWSGGPGGTCQQTLFNEVCGGGGTFSRLYAKSCTGSDGLFHTGTQGGRVIKGGVVTLPSGHTFNALVVSNIADFCVYLGSSCGSFGKVDEVRTVNYLWQVPWMGTVARLQSAQDVPDPDGFTTLAETDIR
ncbi:MAG TPA: hypothetical protein VFP98_04470, partial [Candidatus Polarisedimenticolia bacterium]|nr:hypothetical protein [Candidatus Polarisedimenticolia bacterium]